MKFDRIFYGLITVCTLAFAAGCSEKTEAPASDAGPYTLSDTMMHLIALDSVRSCNIGNEVTLSGQVGFNEDGVVKIFPRGSGQVLKSGVSLGDHVGRGQVLATVRSADVAGSYADLSGANADIAIAKREADNAKSLYTAGISSEREYTAAKENYAKALAARGKVQSQLSINGGTSTNASGQYILTAPIDGYLVEKKVNAGAFIRADAGDNLFTISDLKKVWVWANVYESDIPKVREGYPVTVYAMAYPDRRFAGRIDKISEVLDPESKALRARIVLSNADLALKPDMFAKIVVANTESRMATCIPTAALISQDGKSYVVVYHARNNLEIAEVTVLKTVNDQTYVTGGVAPGQAVIIRNQLLVFEQLLND